ncbi:hypothetical protein TGRH88_075470 [Toxoplasma gondii]|uniref:Uncharacterized protein n=1 Tax=Toxoplasma gondii TaxID=5811 RepID=A0A7J6K5D4_TOXGO|nr:hypothetical protein TGRH88_075470 [Toxoplasma gondii]
MPAPSRRLFELSQQVSSCRRRKLQGPADISGWQFELREPRKCVARHRGRPSRLEATGRHLSAEKNAVVPDQPEITLRVVWLSLQPIIEASFFSRIQILERMQEKGESRAQDGMRCWKKQSPQVWGSCRFEFPDSPWHLRRRRLKSRSRRPPRLAAERTRRNGPRARARTSSTTPFSSTRRPTTSCLPTSPRLV